MPAYNSERYITESVLSVLGQTLRDLELIIVNDASTDKTAEIIDEYARLDSRVKAIHNKTNLQPAISRNKALAEAKGEYIAVLDSDDICLPDRLKVQSIFLDKNPEISLVGCGAQIINSKGEVTGRKQPTSTMYKLKFELLTKNPIIHSSVMYRKSAMNEVGGYDKNYLHSEDYKLYSVLIKKQGVTNLQDILIKYRHVPTAISIAAPTRKIQLEHAFKISYENIQNYLALSENSARIFVDTLYRRELRPGSILRTIKTYKELLAAYISKEKLNKEQATELKNFYRTEIKKTVKSYFKQKFNLT